MGPIKNLGAINIKCTQKRTTVHRTLHSSSSSHLMHVCMLKKTPTEILGSRSVNSNQKKKKNQGFRFSIQSQHYFPPNSLTFPEKYIKTENCRESLREREEETSSFSILWRFEGNDRNFLSR